MNCTCTHPKHHHNGGCKTVTVTGPASSGDNAVPESHPGRTVTPCDCVIFEEAR